MNNNCLYPLYPLQETDELLQISSSILDLPQQDMLHGHDSLVSQDCDPPINTQATISLPDPLGAQDGTDKKVVHRDVERLRRQEMNGLYSSLRSLLPLECIKGKRAISDHMHEASIYIKNMEKRNQELRSKRDKLKRLGSSSVNDGVPEGFSGTGFASVGRSWQGVEIVVGSSMDDEAVPLSKLLEVLSQEGLNAVSCVSTKANERLIHTVQAEIANPGARVDTSGLQQKLTNLVRSMQ